MSKITYIFVGTISLIVFSTALIADDNQNLQVYKWLKAYDHGSVSNINIMNTKDGTFAKPVAGNKMKFPMECGLSMNDCVPHVDGFGSSNIHILVKQGQPVKYAGLNFADKATVAIKADGTVEVDREGVKATDDQGQHWISQKVNQNNVNSIVFIKAR